jgi:hypothetical protein
MSYFNRLTTYPYGRIYKRKYYEKQVKNSFPGLLLNGVTEGGVNHIREPGVEQSLKFEL